MGWLVPVILWVRKTGIILVIVGRFVIKVLTVGRVVASKACINIAAKLSFFLILAH